MTKMERNYEFHELNRGLYSKIHKIREIRSPLKRSRVEGLVFSVPTLIRISLIRLIRCENKEAMSRLT